MRSMLSSISIPAIAFATALSLAGCGSDAVKPNTTAPDFMGLGSGSAGDASVRRFDTDSGIIFGTTKGSKKDEGTAGGGTGIGVNAFLWRGALDTIAFMPLASADPFGGVIITDWWTPPDTAGERLKATVFILSKELRSDGVRVNIYRQILQSGQWIDAPVAGSTVGDIENKVLARARRMREQLQAGN